MLNSGGVLPVVSLQNYECSHDLMCVLSLNVCDYYI